MNTKDLIELDLDRLRRLSLGTVSITNQTDVQITYQICLADSHEPSKVIETTGKVQALFGPRLLSSGTHIGDNGGNCVTARVCLQYSKLTKNQPAMASAIKSFLQRAKDAP
jgi:hypothetical protein